MSRILAIAIACVLLTAPMFSQAESDDPRSELCKSVDPLLLISQLVSEGRNDPDQIKRIRILLSSANFVWRFAEDDAREYFSDAYKIAVEHFRENGRKDERTSTGFVILAPDLRFEVVRAIAKRDGDWARQLAEGIMAEFEKAAKDRDERFQPREIGLMLELARENAETQPDLAWYLFRRVMREPLENHWIYTLRGVRVQNPSMADALYRELLMNYKNESPRRLLFLSSYPFPRERIFGIEKYQVGNTIPAEDTNPDLQRQFFTTFFDSISAYAASSGAHAPADGSVSEPMVIVSALAEMEELIIADFPFLLPRFASAKTQALSLMTEELRQRLAERQSLQSNLELGFDERLELMEVADELGKLQDSMIVGLIFWGIKSEAQFQKLEPWLSRIAEDDYRKEATAYFWFLRSRLAIKEGRFSDAEKFAAKVPEVEHFAILAFELAQKQMDDINDVSSAYQTLSSLGKTIRRAEDSATKAKLLLGLASLYRKLNPNFAMDEMAEAVRVINRVGNPDMSSMAVYRQIVGKTSSSYAVFTIPGKGFEEAFRQMAETDISLTLSNARAIDDRYLRTLAVLATIGRCADLLDQVPVDGEIAVGN
jgi:hypothetical protein